MKLYIKTVIGFIVALLIAISLILINISHVRHNKQFLNTIAYQYHQPFEKTIQSYNELFSYGMDKREVLIKFSQFLGQATFAQKYTLEQLDKGFKLLMLNASSVLKQNPKDVRLYLSYANALNVYIEVLKYKHTQLFDNCLKKINPLLCFQYKNEYDSVFLEVESILLTLLEWSPARADILFSLANTYLIIGDKEKGIKYMEKGINLISDLKKGKQMQEILNQIK